MRFDYEIATNTCMAIVVLTVTRYCHVFVSATTHTCVQCKREAVVYDDGGISH